MSLCTYIAFLDALEKYRDVWRTTRCQIWPSLFGGDSATYYYFRHLVPYVSVKIKEQCRSMFTFTINTSSTIFLEGQLGRGVLPRLAINRAPFLPVTQTENHVCRAWLGGRRGNAAATQWLLSIWRAGPMLGKRIRRNRLFKETASRESDCSVG